MRLIRHDAAPDHLELHLIDVDADDTPVVELKRDLADEDLARMERLRGARDRRRCLLRRSHLRRRLGAWLGCAPAKVGLTYGATGKPYLRPGEGGFGVAHSKGHVLIALARRGLVGCDLEWIDADFDWRGALRAGVLTAGEVAQLATQSSPNPFFEMWALKEAGLKCRGQGLTAPAQAIDTCTSGGPQDDDGCVHAAGLKLHPAYAAAVAWT